MSGLPGWAQIPEKADDIATAATFWTALERLGGVTFGQNG
jgi:hypothetical protein